MVSARPAATWLARKLKARKPNSAAKVAARHGRGSDRQRQAAGLAGGRKGRKGANHHHALDAQIEHAGSLGNEFAGCRQQQRRRGKHHADQDVAQELQAMPPILPPAPGRPLRPWRWPRSALACGCQRGW